VLGRKLTCWGRNDYCQLGIGSTAQQNSPTDVVPGAGVSVYVLSVFGTALAFPHEG
jgi:hypothetical protein